MRMRLTDNDLKEIIYERNLPVNFKSENGLEERDFVLNHLHGSASFKEQWFDGIHISEGKIMVKETVEMHMESDSPIIEMHFSLSGTSHVSMKGKKEKLVFDAKNHNIFYMPSFDGYLETGKQTEPNHAFEIHLTPAYFKRVINSECAVLNSFSEKMEKQEIFMMSQKHMDMTAQMNRIIWEMMQCGKKGALKRLFIESKVLELLMLQIEQFENGKVKKESGQLKKCDVEKLHQAKYLLEKNISHAYSLTELAKHTGLNEFKLKKGFKEVFGNTVFGYLHDLRMEMAKHLLLDLNNPISQVAEYCGYEHVQHFTTAFKNKHGITPGRFRN